MDDAELRALIDRLDGAVPREGAAVRLAQYGGGPEEGQIIANTPGYLRLGIELIKGRLAPQGKSGNPYSIDLELDYLLTSDSDIGFDWFERRDDLPVTEVVTTLADRVVPPLILGCLLAGFVLAIIGFYSVKNWILTHWFGG